MKIFPYGETLGELEPGGKLYLYSASDSGQSELTLVHSRSQGRYLGSCNLQKFRMSMLLRSVVEQEVFLPEEYLPPTSEGEYYHYQLIGLRVETTGRKANRDPPGHHRNRQQ